MLNGPQPPEILDGVDLVARGHGRVRGEDDLLAHLPPRCGEVEIGLHAVGDQLDAGEDRVPLVEMVEVDGQVKRAQGAHPADAQEHLLGDPAVGRGVVEAAGDPAVALVDGLEEEEGRDGVAGHAPHATLDLARGHPHPHAPARVGERVRGVVAPEVVRVAVGADALHGVALRPAQPHAHHGDAEVARGLHEVAGQHAQAPGIGRELLVKPELHREVGDERRSGGGHSTKAYGKIRGSARPRRPAKRAGGGERAGV